MAIDPILKTDAAPNWEKIGIRTHHGLCTPLFSLRSHKSSGIGEYFDLIPLIDLCKSSHFDVIQLLPINDSGLDPSPYNAISSKALHPIYLSLHKLPYLEKYPELIQELETFKPLNETQRLDYKLILNKKTEFLLKYFERASKDALSSDGYLKFIKDNTWVEAYAVFKSLKIKNNWKSWKDWAETDAPDSSSVQFQIFVQYLCFVQMQEVKAYAAKNHIFLMGDIPILVSPDSADVWHNPELFIQDFAAGAPPDMYNPDGQYWGFPLYNYEEMAKDNNSWWKNRLDVSTRLYDLYRIDHVIGFFRIWAFPRDKTKDGRFIPSDEKTWIPQGEQFLRMMLQASPMLPIGEDLGVIPHEVRACLQSLGICGTKVMRWERKWEEDKSFIKPEDYIRESMTCVSTHDSDTLKLWWENSPEEASVYAQSKGWQYEPVLTLDQQKDILKESHHTGSLFHVNLLQEYLDLFPEYRWPNLSDERINIPGIISDRNWTFRYKPFLEDLLKDYMLKKTLAELSS